LANLEHLGLLAANITILQYVVDETVDDLLKGDHELLLALLLQVQLDYIGCLLAHVLHNHQSLLRWYILTIHHAAEVFQVCRLGLLGWANGCTTTVH
jgi:hypothetical protein